MIPVFDSTVQHESIREELAAAFARVAGSGWFILGDEVAAFEKEFAEWVGVKHCIGVASGTDALTLALRALQVGPGDEVITVSHTAVATVAAIALTGATPVLVDIREDTYTLDPAAIVGAITPRTKAVVPVHLYGHPADMDPIMAVAHAHRLAVVEDCAQAHGARYKGRAVGTFGALATFSFYPTKNLGALGDGGAVVTGNDSLAHTVRSLRQYGWKDRYISVMPGMNSRLDELQAAFLKVKLIRLGQWNETRRRLAAVYTRLLKGVMPPCELADCQHVYHLYVVRTPHRNELAAHLKDHGVATAIHYPLPVHQQPAYRGLVPTTGLPVTERIGREILTLPLYPELGTDRVQAICDTVRAWHISPHTPRRS